MNSERLHKILTEIQLEFNDKNMLVFLQAVRDNLSNAVSQPQQPAYQQTLVISLKELGDNLENSIFNTFSPGWKQIIDEIGGAGLFGIDLKKQIDEIFSRNQITPAAALEEINSIVSKVELIKIAIDEIISGFVKLKIGREELLPGQCEMGYSIPRTIIENKLSSFSKEVQELNFILSVLSEAIVGKKDDFEVKTISSSDFLLYILIGLKVGEVISGAIERIILNYKTILEIKLLRNQLKEKNVPVEATQPIEEHANSLMEAEIRKIASEIISEHYEGKPDRKNELENATTIALNKIANRIDKGFNIEIRVEPLPETTEKNKNETSHQEKINSIINIQKSAGTLQYINTSGPAILHLSEGDTKQKKPGSL